MSDFVCKDPSHHSEPCPLPCDDCEYECNTRYIKEIKTYHIVGITMKGNEGKQLRKDTIYAKLVDSDDKLVISATLEHILRAVRDRGLDVEGVTVDKSNKRCSLVTLDLYEKR